MRKAKTTQSYYFLNKADLDLLIDLLTRHNPTLNGLLAYSSKKQHLSECRAKTFLKRIREKLMMQHIYNDEKWKNPK